MDARAELFSLPVEQRQVLELRELQGWSYEQIAGAMGICRQEVGVRLTAARRELLRRLKMGDNGPIRAVGFGAQAGPEVAA